MAGLASIAREVEKKNFSVITSVITIAEILTGRSGEEVVAEFRKLLQRSNFQLINVDERIERPRQAKYVIITSKKRRGRKYRPSGLRTVSILRLLLSQGYPDFTHLMVATRKGGC